MKRTALKRSKPLRRSALKPGKPLKRRTRLRQVNPERAAAARLRDFGPEAEWLRDQPCAICGERPPSDPMHAFSRKAGARREHQLPGCRTCHRRQHSTGVRSFEQGWGINLLEIAAGYAWRWSCLAEPIKDHYRAIFRARYPASAALLDRGLEEGR